MGDMCVHWSVDSICVQWPMCADKSLVSQLDSSAHSIGSVRSIHTHTLDTHIPCPFEIMSRRDGHHTYRSHQCDVKVFLCVCMYVP